MNTVAGCERQPHAQTHTAPDKREAAHTHTQTPRPGLSRVYLRPAGTRPSVAGWTSHDRRSCMAEAMIHFQSSTRTEGIFPLFQTNFKELSLKGKANTRLLSCLRINSYVVIFPSDRRLGTFA